MGSVVLLADETVAARRDVVYGLFGARQGAGWVFAADCDVLAVGSAVTLHLPVGVGQAAVDALGRVASLAPPRQIVIALDQPWCGRLRVRLDQAGAESTRVTVSAEIDDVQRRRAGGRGFRRAAGTYGPQRGGGGPGHVFRWGERPADQLATAAVPLMRTSGARHWFLVGDDYSWSHGAHRAARQVLPQAHGMVVGERFVPLGTKDFERASSVDSCRRGTGRRPLGKPRISRE